MLVYNGKLHRDLKLDKKVVAKYIIECFKI